MSDSYLEWADIRLAPDPELIVGWRPRRSRLDAAAIELSEEVADELLERCGTALDDLAGLTGRPYEGYPDIEPAEEYLMVPARDLPRSRPSKEEPDDEISALSDLERLVATAGLPPLSRNDLRKGTYLFYAVICTDQASGQRIGFVRQINPYQVAKTGKLMALLGHEGLERLEEPLFVFDGAFDLVVTPERIAVLRMEAFNRMFADLNTLVAAAPANAKLVADSVSRMTPEAVQALGDAASERPSIARRLQRLVRTGAVPAVTPDKIAKAMRKHRLDPADIVINGEIRFVAENAPVFLDLVEQLYYETDFTGEHRRSDRYSPLKP